MKSPGSCPPAKVSTPRSGRGCSATWPTAWPRSTLWTTPASISTSTSSHPPPDQPTPPSASPWCRSPAHPRRSCPWTRCPVKEVLRRLVYPQTPPKCTVVSRSCLPQTDSLHSSYPMRHLRQTAPLSPCTPITSTRRSLYQLRFPPEPHQATRTRCGDPGEKWKKDLKDFKMTLNSFLFVQC